MMPAWHRGFIYMTRASDLPLLVTTRQESWRVPWSLQTQRETAPTGPRMVKFPHLPFISGMSRVSALLHDPNPSTERRGKIQLHLQRRWRSCTSPRDSASTFSFPPAPHPIGSSSPPPLPPPCHHFLSIYEVLSFVWSMLCYIVPSCMK